MDRVDKGRLLVRVDIVRVALVAGLVTAIVMDLGRLWLLFLVTLLLGVGETLFDTGATAFVPSVITPSRLPWANGRLQSVRVMGNDLIGPAFGGLLFAAAPSSPFVLNAVSFAVSAVVLSRIRPAEKVVEEGQPVRTSSMRSEIMDGVRLLARDPSLRVLAIIVGVWNLFGHLGDSIFVLYAQDVLGLDSRGYGFMIAGISVGSVISTLLASRFIDRFGQTAVLHLASTSFGLFTLLVASTNRAAVAIVCFFTVALTSYAWNVVSSSIRQTLIPAEYLGRVISAYMVIAVGTSPIGMFAGGFLAKWLGYRRLFAISGSVMLLTSIVAWRSLTRIAHQADAIVAASF